MLITERSDFAFFQEVDDDQVYFPLGADNEAAKQETIKRLEDEGKSWWTDAPRRALGPYSAIPQKNA